MDDRTIYCSLDIETSGFDPAKNEILEIGLAFFVVEAKENASESNAKGERSRIRITEEYTRVFKPKGEVPATILGLTGIGQKELDEALPFEQYKAEIQEKVRGAVIVGHNVIFDIKFLQSVGVEFSGTVIDTLDLVQFILPTHHSYNLENLMHTFGVPHTEAHRALPDSRAAVYMLEAFLQVYTGFPNELKQKIVKLSKAHQLPWATLLDSDLPPKIFPIVPPKLAALAELNLRQFRNKVIYNFPIGENCVQQLIKTLATGRQKALVVLPKVQQVMSLWKQGLAEPIIAPEQQFNETKFAALLKKEVKTLDEVKFILKIFVWKYTNWQTQCLLDLNLSFFGGQFKELICGGKFTSSAGAKVLCTDHETFLTLSRLGLHTKRSIVIVGLREFEDSISSNLGTKASWGFVAYVLKSVFNPELGTGDASLKERVIEALAATDLFFGLVGALLQEQGKNFQYITLTPELLNSDHLGKIKIASDHYIEKLTKWNAELQLEEIKRIIKNLENFFTEDPSQVKWIELADNRCVLLSAPLSITALVASSIKPYGSVCFADSLASEKLSDYFVKRLGLESFSLQQLSLAAVQTKQGDLFITPEVKTIKCYCQAQNIESERILAVLSADNLPAAVLFSTTLQIKKFYEEYYNVLKARSSLFAQSNSGGSNKIFHNFSIHDNSVLIASDKFILKHLQNNRNVDPVEHLRVKTLILCHLPFEQFSHPYQEAISGQFANSFTDFSLPRAVYNLQAILEFFASDSLEKIYICDAKIGKDYAKAFKEYLKSIPRLQLME